MGVLSWLFLLFRLVPLRFLRFARGLCVPSCSVHRRARFLARRWSARSRRLVRRPRLRGVGLCVSACWFLCAALLGAGRSRFLFGVVRLGGRPVSGAWSSGRAGCVVSVRRLARPGWWLVFERVGFSGSRSLAPAWAGLVARVVAGFAGSPLAVGCCRGADALVRAASPGVRVFRASGSRPGQLVARSVSLVRWLVAGGPGSCLVVFVSGPCPAGVVPGPQWPGGGSGSWASAALAAGLGCRVVVFWCGPGPVSLPAAWGCWLAGSGALAGGWVLSPGQKSLF